MFRAANVGDVSSWTYYDGHEFIASALDPYRDDLTHVRPCAALQLVPGNVVGSVVRYLKTGTFIAVMAAQGVGYEHGGILFSTSHDLLTWSKPRLLASFPLATVQSCDEAFTYAYPSLLDPKSPSRVFDSISDNAYLYVTRIHMAKCGMTPDRDLIRVRVTIQ